ncbi:hypothetical protein BH18ACT7_BH18ACT7_11390 [soil metagenome]
MQGAELIHYRIFMYSFANFFQYFFIKSRKILGAAACYQPFIYHHFFIYPLHTCIDQIGFHRMI